MKKWLWPGLIAGLLGALIWLAFFWDPTSSSPTGTPNSPPHRQLQLAEKPAGGDFTLNGPDGRVSLEAQRGKVVLLYFGYTFCPDICPTTLSSMAQALSALSAEELARVRAYFISVDPQRDTMDILKVYAPFFHPAISGLNGSPDEIARVAALYGARYMKQKPDAYGLYSVDHSASTYLVGTDGKLADTLPHGHPATDMTARIRQLLKNSR